MWTQEKNIIGDLGCQVLKVVYLEFFCCILLAIFYKCLMVLPVFFNHKKYKARFGSVRSPMLSFDHWYRLCHIVMTTSSSPNESALKYESSGTKVVSNKRQTHIAKISQRLWRLNLRMHARFINRNGRSIKMKNFNTSVSCRHFMGKGGRNSTVRKWPHLLMLESKENQL